MKKFLGMFAIIAVVKNRGHLEDCRGRREEEGGRREEEGGRREEEGGRKIILESEIFL